MKCGGNMEIITFGEVYNVSVSVHFAFECHNTQPPSVVFGLGLKSMYLSY
jgi:hypothetical protein